MAKETIVRLRDDIDGSLATKAIQFSWDGTAYEIDLNAKNARAFERVIAPYVKAAHRIPSTPVRRSDRKGSTRSSPKLDLAAIRAWAVENGHKVADRGRVPNAVIEAFHAAQQLADAVTVEQQPKKRVARKKAAAKAASRRAVAKHSAAKKAAARQTETATPVNTAESARTA